ncbi:hypothetical protein V499_06718 [Pseudogymnoascus sp. VKM F-103]|nr:hypothetical protein V499_06718 [Pseudogymnoascus sp. VKM F-103]
MQVLTEEQTRALAAETRGPILLGLSISFTVLSSIFVVLRVIARFWIIKGAGWEDYTIVVAVAFNVGMAACQIQEVRYGTGRHVQFLETSQVVGILKYLFWSIISYCVTLSLVKTSILLQYYRIFGGNDATRYAIYVALIIVIAFGTECVISDIWTCVPVQAFWELSLRPTSKCVDQNKLFLANACINIATDLIIATIPLPIVHKLRIPFRQKIALMVILGIGWFICAVSMLRLNSIIGLAKQADTTFYSGETAYWSTIEVNVAIICACLPTLNPICRLIFPRYFRSTQSAKYDSNSERMLGNNAFVQLAGGASASKSRQVGKRSCNGDEDGLRAAERYQAGVAANLNGDDGRAEDGNEQAIRVESSVQQTVYIEDDESGQSYTSASHKKGTLGLKRQPEEEEKVEQEKAAKERAEQEKETERIKKRRLYEEALSREPTMK